MGRMTAKGHGLIMLILVVSCHRLCAHRAVTVEQTQDFVAVSQQAVSTCISMWSRGRSWGSGREDVTEYMRPRHFKPGVKLALRQLVNDLSTNGAIQGPG